MIEPRRPRVDWQATLRHAAGIVDSYDTPVTLRQLFYRLVADHSLPNLRHYYSNLSHVSAEARRDGRFPGLADNTSRIERHVHFSSPDSLHAYARSVYRRDRTEGQEWTTYLGVEKAGLSAQLWSWFTSPLGIPHVALGGFASQTLATMVRRDVERQGRRSVLVYAGDFDPSGLDIYRDFTERTAFDKTIRVALDREQVAEFGLPAYAPTDEERRKLARDSRAETFRQSNGELVQYEVDALDPDTLKDLYQTAVDGFWDMEAYAAVMAREHEERDQL